RVDVAVELGDLLELFRRHRVRAGSPLADLELVLQGVLGEIDPDLLAGALERILQLVGVTLLLVAAEEAPEQGVRRLHRWGPDGAQVRVRRLRGSAGWRGGGARAAEPIFHRSLNGFIEHWLELRKARPMPRGWRPKCPKFGGRSPGTVAHVPG